MSFGGSVSAMISSLKSNNSLEERTQDSRIPQMSSKLKIQIIDLFLVKKTDLLLKKIKNF